MYGLLLVEEITTKKRYFVFDRQIESTASNLEHTPSGCVPIKQVYPKFDERDIRLISSVLYYDLEIVRGDTRIGSLLAQAANLGAKNKALDVMNLDENQRYFHALDAILNIPNSNGILEVTLSKAHAAGKPEPFDTTEVEEG